MMLRQICVKPFYVRVTVSTSGLYLTAAGDTLPSYEHASAIPENRRREGFLVSVVGESGAYEANLMGIRAATMRTKLNKTREGALRALLWMTASARASKL